MKPKCTCILTVFFCLFWVSGLFAQAQPTDRSPILSAAEFDYPPFSLIDENNQPTGFSVELLKATLQAMGYEVTFTTGSWAKIKQQLIDEQIQVLPLVGRTPEREKLFDFTFPYLHMHGTIIVRTDNKEINSLPDLRGKQVAVLRGDNAEEFLRHSNLGATIVPTDSFATALLDLSQGHYDAVVIQKLLAFQLLQQYSLKNLHAVGPPLEEFVQSFCFAVPKGQRQLLRVLNEGLSIVMANGTFQKLHEKWFAPRVRSKSRIVVGGDKQYPPYEYLDENGQPAGFNVDLTRAIAEQLNLDISIELDSWNSIRQRLLSGNIDIIQGMFYSPERDKVVDFSPPHSIVGHTIVTRKGDLPFSNLGQLHGKSILVMEGDILHDLALKMGLTRELITVPSQEEALRRLAEGQADCALAARIPAFYWIRKHHWDNLLVGQESILSPEESYAALHGNGALLADFSEGLHILKENGQYRQLYSKWFAPYDSSENSVKTTIRYTIYGVTPVVILLLIISLWSRTLKKQVNQKTAELQQEIAVRRQTEAILQAEKQKFHTLFEHVADYALVLQRQGDDLLIVDLSESACRHHGYERHELIGKSINLLDVDGADLTSKGAPIRHLHPGETLIFEVSHRCKDGSIFPVEVTLRPLQLDKQEFILAIERDITQRKKAQQDKENLENHLRQKYKMEAVGVMAGGIAHNFNNNLAIILGNLELAQRKNSAEEEVKTFLHNAQIAVRRSRDLVRQILTYSRKESEQIESVQPNMVIEETVKLLKATLPSTINLCYQVASSASLATIEANSTKLEEALINLCTNAVHAMEEKGDLTIALAIVDLQEQDLLPQYPCQPGSYISIKIMDTGCGIAPQVIDRIFDPFFTTKDVEQGTGMGLATVQGFVKKSHGMIRLQSTVNQGSSFELLFPVTPESNLSAQPQTGKLQLPTGSGHILLIDDEQMLTEMISMMLTDAGYQVTAETSSTAGLKRLSETPERFDLLLTDQTMPELTGTELIVKAKAIKPNLPVILCSGYSSKVSEEDIERLGIDAFCLKPLEMSALLATISRVLK